MSSAFEHRPQPVGDNLPAPPRLAPMRVRLIAAGEREHAEFRIQPRLPRSRRALGRVVWMIADRVVRSDVLYGAQDADRRHLVLWCERADRGVALPPMPVAVCARKGLATDDPWSSLVQTFYASERTVDEMAERPWSFVTGSAIATSRWGAIAAAVWPLGPVSGLLPDDAPTVVGAMRTVARRRCLDQFQRTGQLPGNLARLCALLATGPEGMAVVRWLAPDGDRAAADGEPAPWHWAQLYRLSDGETGSCWFLVHHDGQRDLGTVGPFRSSAAARAALEHDCEIEVLGSWG